MRYGLLAIFLVSLAADVSAQAITGVRLTVYGRGTSSVVASGDVPITAARCGLTPKLPAPTGTVSNPVAVRWDDPANVALDCEYADPGSGVLASVPLSQSLVYDVTARYVNPVGMGPESARSGPFTRPGVAPTTTPGNVRVRP